MKPKHAIVSQPPTISIEECTTIIKRKLNSTNFQIIDYKLTPLDTRNGFLGEHRQLLITIKHDNGQMASMFCFAKFLPENQAQIDFAIMCGVFKKETFVYDVLLPKIRECGIDYLKTCIPECYYTKENYILVFNDVSKAGFKGLSKFGYLDYDHVMVTLKSMAKLHASALIFEEKMSKKLNKTYRLTDDYKNYFYETFYVDDLTHKGGQGVHAALKGLYSGFRLFPEYNSYINNAKFNENVKKLCLEIFELVKPSKKYRNTICHGDLWSTNIMIKYDNNKPIDCLLLDFQTVRYCPPAHDFISFIHLTTTKQFRDLHLSDLQKIYYKELTSLLANWDCDIKNVVTFEEFVESCEEQKRFAVVQTVTYVQLTQAKDKWITEYTKNVDLWNEALYGDRSRMVIENCKEDPDYKFVFSEALKDFSELCKV